MFRPKQMVAQFVLMTLIFAPLPSVSLSAAVKRIEISKSTQGESPVEFSLKAVTAESAVVGIELSLPEEQAELADLWKVYLWVLDGKNADLSVPLDLTHTNRVWRGQSKRSLVASFRGDVDMLSRSCIAIRCGKHAPKVETIYQINVASYLAAEAIIDSETALKTSPKIDAMGINEAIRVAHAAVKRDSRLPDQELKVTSAQLLALNGAYVWRVTLKPIALLPNDPSKEPIGVGGEVFVNVDSVTKKVELGYGE